MTCAAAGLRPQAPVGAGAHAGLRRVLERLRERLHIHVNTVRYRIRRIEEPAGRNLATMADQVDFFPCTQGCRTVPVTGSEPAYDSGIASLAHRSPFLLEPPLIELDHLAQSVEK
ncbi:helix-turn-helix domain-containing protein [Nonomuraea sp. NPDC049695]|uniref:helix-turn-helix domain-containing protein n=1 Tax=Nonomuraea sp. NPDC049695 TaxID=3154734 RepID=UPI0034132832